MNRIRSAALAALIALAALTGAPALAQTTIDEVLPDPAMEQRAIAIHKQLRCLVCQNQSIHESNATLAHDLRMLVRERLAVGDSDEQAIQYLVTRYGDWVLLKPPMKPETLALWLGPPIILIVGGVGAFVYFRRARRRAPEAPLSEAEQQRARRMLADPAD